MVSSIRGYYSDHNIPIFGKLCNDLKNDNRKALAHIHYAISTLLYVNGVEEVLREIANVSIPGFEGERIYENRLTELFCVRFVHETLGHQIIDVESKSNKILSPHRKRKNSSCDIKSEDRGRDVYFEVKDSSKETTTSYIEKGLTHCEPMDDEDIISWLKNKINEAGSKGANFLICRVPTWIDTSIESFPTGWAKRVFGVDLIGNEAYYNFNISNYENSFKGVYITKPGIYINIPESGWLLLRPTP